VNLVAVCIFSPKSKEFSKVLIGYLIPPPLRHPVKISYISPLLNIQGGKELSNCLIILILSKSHNISQVFGFTCNHIIIKDPIMLSLHVVSVNPLGNCHRLIFGDHYQLIKVMLECSVKHVVNPNLLLNKPQIFLPFHSHQISLSFVADFLPLIRIMMLPEDWSPHVNVGGRVGLLYIKSFFLLITTIITPFTFLLNFVPYYPAATSTCQPFAFPIRMSPG
jgi:hypothetical protein